MFWIKLDKRKKWVPFVDFYFVKGWLLLLFKYFIPFQISFHKLVSRWTCFNISLFRIPQCTTNNNLLQSAASNTNTTNYYQYESTIEMNVRNKNNRALSNLTTHYLGICLSQQPDEYCNFCILTQTLLPCVWLFKTRLKGCHNFRLWRFSPSTLGSGSQETRRSCTLRWD